MCSGDGLLQIQTLARTARNKAVSFPCPLRDQFRGLIKPSLYRRTTVEESDQILSTLRTIRLDDPLHPPYIALSYTWGSLFSESRRPTPSQLLEWCISCDSKHLNVHQNLYNALLVLQERVPEAWLWIDAICIDQDNKVERGNQVSTMDHVFAEAAGVLLWLGPQDDSSSTALHLMAGYCCLLLTFMVSTTLGSAGGRTVEEDNIPLWRYGRANEYHYLVR